MNKVFFVSSICRQIEGDIISVRFEKAFSDKDKAFEYANALAKTYVETLKIPDTDGKMHNIKFACERSVHELDLE
jgi:hypothetical protein